MRLSREYNSFKFVLGSVHQVRRGRWISALMDPISVGALGKRYDQLEIGFHEPGVSRHHRGYDLEPPVKLLEDHSTVLSRGLGGGPQLGSHYSGYDFFYSLWVSCRKFLQNDSLCLTAFAVVAFMASLSLIWYPMNTSFVIKLRVPFRAPKI